MYYFIGDLERAGEELSYAVDKIGDIEKMLAYLGIYLEKSNSIEADSKERVQKYKISREELEHLLKMAVDKIPATKIPEMPNMVIQVGGRRGANPKDIYNLPLLLYWSEK